MRASERVMAEVDILSGEDAENYAKIFANDGLELAW